MSALPVNLTKNPSHFLIELPEALSLQGGKEFQDMLDQIKGLNVIIDCTNKTSIPKDWLRTILKLHLNLKSEGKRMRLVGVNNILQNFFKSEGIDGIFDISKDEAEALVKFGGQPKKKLDTEFIDPFLTAVIHVLNVQAGVTVIPGKVMVKKPDQVTMGDISGIIGIVSDSFNGSVIITFPEQTFLGVMTSMLGEECTELNKDIVDGAGELINIIFGQAKITLNEKGYGINTALPSVVTGKGHSLTSMTKGVVVVVEFSSTVGSFCVEICV